MVIIIPNIALFAVVVLLALPYFVAGWRLLARRGARELPQRHGLRELK